MATTQRALFHGDNTTQSRAGLMAAVASLKAAGYTVDWLDGATLDRPTLESTLLTATLFGQNALVIENLMSRLKSKEKEACLDLLASYQGDKPILLWEKKEVTKAQLAKLPKDFKITVSKAPAAVFGFLDALYPGNLRQIRSLFTEVQKTTPDLLAFTLLARHIAALITVQSASSPKLPPWQLGKLRGQAAKFSPTDLQRLHAALITIDEKVKTGQTKLSYYDHLDILFVNQLG